MVVVSGSRRAAATRGVNRSCCVGTLFSLSFLFQQQQQERRRRRLLPSSPAAVLRATAITQRSPSSFFLLSSSSAAADLALTVSAAAFALLRNIAHVLLSSPLPFFYLPWPSVTDASSSLYCSLYAHSDDDYFFLFLNSLKMFIP